MKTDIIYTITSKHNEFMCIDEIKDDGNIIHHDSGIYALMDNPNNEELRFMINFCNSTSCTEMVQNMEENESKYIFMNNYEVTITVKSISEGGLF